MNPLQLREATIRRGTIPIVASCHFIRQFYDRDLEGDLDFARELEGRLTRSLLIEKRPNAVRILINNHFRKAIYIYDKATDLLAVLERSRETREFVILKTAYRGKESGWVAHWVASTPQTERMTLGTFYPDLQARIIVPQRLNTLPAELVEEKKKKKNTPRRRNIAKLIPEQHEAEQREAQDRKAFALAFAESDISELPEFLDAFAGTIEPETLQRFMGILGEKQVKSVTQLACVMAHLGEEAADALLEKTVRREACGGMLTVDGSRRRTSGGIFLHLAKEQIDKTEWYAIGKAGRRIRRNLAEASGPVRGRAPQGRDTSGLQAN